MKFNPNDLYSIIAPYTGRTYRYAVVNSSNQAAVGSASWVTLDKRVYFTSEDDANKFLVKFNKLYGDRGLDFRVVKNSSRNERIKSSQNVDETVPMKYVYSNCGPCLVQLKGAYTALQARDLWELPR